MLSKKRRAASSLGLGAIAFPLLALVLAIIFSPVGLGASNSNCNLFSGPSCSLSFHTNATIVLSTSGYSLYYGQYQTCQSYTTSNGVSITQIPVIGYLSQLPVLSNVYDFFTGLGASISGNTALQSTCLSQLGNLLVFHYTGTDLVLLLIGVIVSSAAIAALSGITILGTSGMNAAGTYIVFMVSSLSLLWLVLTAFAYPTFAEMPVVIGGTLYTILTLLMAIGILDMIS